MLRKALVALSVFALLGASADAALQTDSFDPVEAEVLLRDAALNGDLTKPEKKVKKAYAQVIKLFEKESTSRKKDAKLIHKIVLKLNKVHPAGGTPEDVAMQDLITQSLADFLAELEYDLDLGDRGTALLGDENKHKKSADKKQQKAEDKLAQALAEPDLKKRLKLCRQAEGKAAQARAKINKALDVEEPNLTAHEYAFLREFQEGYTNALQCIQCHTDAGDHVVATGHWKWEGTSDGIVGHEGETHGKNDIINNFCIAVPTNEPRCTQCHIGYGYADDTFDFSDQSKIDCLVCHDATKTYAKDLKTAGLPKPDVNLMDVVLDLAAPARHNCLPCHTHAGGGDNVKHGDLSSDLHDTTAAFDVHMGTDGENMDCIDCHKSDDHGIEGFVLHSLDEGRNSCTDAGCHTATPHGGILDTHVAKVACQSCHIPTFARALPTKTEWYWEDAGQNVDPIPTDQYGKPLYDKKKGTFVWEKNVVPELLWYDGTWTKALIGANDQWTTLPANLAMPQGSLADPGSKLYPFKKMIGTQPADANNQTILVPHLFGTKGGPNPYWGKFDWDLALADGANRTGQTYTGQFEFIPTVMYLAVNHEIAPKEQARGCNDCHNGGIDFEALGYPGDPSNP